MNFTEYITKMRALATKLASTGKPIIEEDLVTCILTSLNQEPKYENVIVSILSRGGQPSFEDVYSILLNHEGRLEHKNQLGNYSLEANIVQRVNKNNLNNQNNKRNSGR